MKRNIIILALYCLLGVMALSLAGLLSVSLLYLGSFSLSPLNLWQEKDLSTRIEELKAMDFEDMARDVSGEFRYQFRERIERPHEQNRIQAKVDKEGFRILKNGEWQEIFVKGVNIGAALPGKWFTEFPDNERVYLDWMEKIGAMNANSIRVYTLLPPQFYKVLEYYNITHADNPLWLFQEIWPEENPEGKNYLARDNSDAYLHEIQITVDAVHGNAQIPQRQGRAYGDYDSDISPYILGYLVGRELEPDEVVETDLKNQGYAHYGEYLSSGPGASPTEGWLAMNCNALLRYEEKHYGVQHPVSIVSWPTLDITEHDSEWNSYGLKSLEYNDKVSVDINHIATNDRLEAGFFGAYHIYPNYPDFMNNEEKYERYEDPQGRFMYGGYLQEFIATHSKYPALVAEFGLSTGMGNAHYNPDGYHHGDLTEEEQGQGIVRMMKAIHREGYTGGLIFEWMDEWAKKTWITEPFMIPYERQVLWHNTLDPEQNYGLYAMEPSNSKQASYAVKGEGRIQQIELNSDAAFLYITVSLAMPADFGRETLLLGLDTYDRVRGELRFSGDLKEVAASGMEFLVEITGEGEGKISVIPSYNIGEDKYSSVLSSEGRFEEIRLLTNKERVTRDGRYIEAAYQDGSTLNYGSFSNNSHNHWYVDHNTIHIRIPWGRINITDPSSHMVLDDPGQYPQLERDLLQTVKSEGIMVYGLLSDKEKQKALDRLAFSEPYLWEGWDVADYTPRLKMSYYIIKDFFSQF